MQSYWIISLHANIRINALVLYMVGSTTVGQTKVYEIGICCFSAKHAAGRSKIKDWLARNQDNVSEWRIFMNSNSNRWLNVQI